MGNDESFLTRVLNDVSPGAVFTAFLLVISTYALVEAISFRPQARLFPMIVSGSMVVGCGLILLEKYLPPSLSKVVVGDTGTGVQIQEKLSGDDGDIDDELEEVTETFSGADPDVDLAELTTVGTIFAIICGFSLLGLLIGFLYAAPLFAVFYSWYVGLRRRNAIVVVAIAIGTPYLFEILLRVNLRGGILF